MKSSNKLQLSTHIPYKLAVLSNSIKRTTSDVFVNDSLLSSRDWRVMVIIGVRVKVTATNIVESTGMDKATVTRACQSLEKQGFIKRLVNSEDRRSQWLTLTSSGNQEYSRLIPYMQASADDYRTVLTEGEAILFLELINKLQSHANQQLKQLGETEVRIDTRTH